MIRFRSQLMNHPDMPELDINQRIAVQPLIFTKSGKLILIERGDSCRDSIGKLESVGGDIGPHRDLHEALFSRIRRKLGLNISVSINEYLGTHTISFITKENKEISWIIVTYLCKLENEKLPNRSPAPGKVKRIKEFSLEELFGNDQNRLSPSTVKALEVYRHRYGDKPY